jgi:transposase
MNQATTTFVGLDDHKQRIQVSVLWPGGQARSRWEIANEPRALRQLARKLREEAAGEVMCCYEAGPNGYTLQRRLQTDGVRCKVVAPSLTPIQPGRRIKTNRRDADKLAELLAAGLLTEVQPPTPAQEAVRDLCRCREQAKADLTRYRHRITKLLLRRGVVYRTGRNWTKRHRQWLWSVRFEHPVDQTVLEDYLLAIEQLEARLGQIETCLEEIAQQAPYLEPVGWLRCFRGIDTVSALTLVAELYAFERFRTPRRLMAYVGLVPSEASTGERQRRGAITKAGNKRVRRLLVEAAWHYRHRPAVGVKPRRLCLGGTAAGSPEAASRLVAPAGQAKRRSRAGLQEVDSGR